MMDVGENGGGLSVAEEPLSSPPSSLSDLSPQRSDLANHHSRDTTSFGVSAPQQPAKNSPLPLSATTTATATAPSSGNEQKPRKKREPVVLPDGTVRERKKPGPKPKPKDPNAPVQPRKKKQKMSDAPTYTPPNIQLQQSTLQVSRQPKITDLVGTIPSNPSPVPANSEIHLGSNPPSHVAPLGTPNTPRPASSGQLFDPIRGDTVQAGQASSRLSTASPTATHNPGRLVPSTSNVTSAPVSPLPPNVKSMNPFTAPPNSALAPRPSAPLVPSVPSHTEMESERLTKKLEPGSAGPSSNAPTPPPTKQRAKEQPPPLPTGSGLLAGTPFGIGSVPTATGSTGANIWLTFPLKGQTNVTINYAREVEKKYGFAALHPRLAAQNERRRAMAAASNALEKGEKAAGVGSADDMSLDLSEAESNAEMGGIDDENSTAGGLPDGRKRRRRKAEDYDRNDEFIDDTEMAWEEQALMAKDGFFVYSGPLVTETEKPTIERYVTSLSWRLSVSDVNQMSQINSTYTREFWQSLALTMPGSLSISSLNETLQRVLKRSKFWPPLCQRHSLTRTSADGTVKRGRGRGRGGSARGETSGRGRGRGGGPGSRGGATVRKPRVTKADRAMMEQEKLEREKMAATLAKPQYASTAAAS
jgi:hypothetical protein